MGYLLKKIIGKKEFFKVFYSEPKYGFYLGSVVNLSIDEYNENMKENDFDFDDYVFVGKWGDVSGDLFGEKVTKFVADCILQGKNIELNKPFEF